MNLSDDPTGNLSGEQWFRFPYHLAKRLWVFKSFGPLAVYLALLSHAGRDGRCWPSKEKLCEETGLSRDCVRRALRHLEKRGLVRAKLRRDRSSVYYIKSTLPPLKTADHIPPQVYESIRIPVRANKP